LASGGYPGNYAKGKVIKGLDEAQGMKDIMVFHSGTKLEVVNGKLEVVTSGGRVLGVTALGKDIDDAIDRVYKAVGKISFDGMHYRRDIARKAVMKIGV